MEIANALFRPRHAREYHRKHCQRLGVVGTDLECGSYRLLRLGKTRFTCENQPEINECLGVLRIVFCRLAKKFFCFSVFSLLPV